MEKIFPTSTGFWSNEPFFIFSHPVNAAKSLLDNRDHSLAEARSELMKQEYKVESPNTCTGELQRHMFSQRLELEDAHFGHEQSRREQVRLQEELVMREKALRKTQITSIHEMGELKRAQELRVDEFSVQKLRESPDTKQKLASQTQGENRITVDTFLTFPVNRQSIQALDSC